MSEVLKEISWKDVIASISLPAPAERASRSQLAWMRENTHSHKYDEVAVTLQGDHCYGVDGQIVQLAPGVVLSLPRGKPHDNGYPPTRAECIDLWMAFLPSGHVTMSFTVLRPSQEEMIIPIPLPAADLHPELTRLVTLFDEHAENREAEIARQNEFYLLYFITRLFRSLSQMNFLHEKIDERAIIKGVRQYVSENLTESLTLKDLAKVAGYSPFHFHRMFVKAEGITPHNFIERERIDLACSLLRTGRSVTSAAYDSGFASSSQFARTFRKHLHVTPSKWLVG
ncbi:MAG: helix-turn-helix domain-containing protein [Chthoniobacterales bacterium]